MSHPDHLAAIQVYPPPEADSPSLLAGLLLRARAEPYASSARLRLPWVAGPGKPRAVPFAGPPVQQWRRPAGGKAADRAEHAVSQPFQPATPVRPRPGADPGWRPSLQGGIPARQRKLRQHGRRTIRNVLEAGLAELADKGYQALRVDDVTRRAGISHGTFYLYFASKEDLFTTLVADVLHDMLVIAGEFPVVTPDSAGRAVLRRWVRRFGDLYASHATIIRILSQAEVVGEECWAEGMRVLFRLGQAIAQGMTAAPRSRQAVNGSGSPYSHQDELSALACLTLLERVNYLLAMGVRLPRAEMTDRLTHIIYAAFLGEPSDCR